MNGKNVVCYLNYVSRLSVYQQQHFRFGTTYVSLCCWGWRVGKLPVIQPEVSAGVTRAIVRLLLHTANRRPLRQFIARNSVAHNHAK